jgi:hypothetical protein
VLWIYATLGGLALVILGKLLNPGATGMDSDNPSYGVGFVIGTVVGTWLGMLGLAVVIGVMAGGIFALFKQRFRRTLALAYSISVLGIGIVWVLSQAVAQKLDERQAAKGFKRDLQQFMAESATPGGAHKVDFDPQSKPSSDMARLRLLNQGFLSDIAAIQNDYAAALDADGINVLLDAVRMSNDKDLAESLAIIARLEVTVEKFAAKANAAMTSFPERMKDYDLKESSKDGLAIGYERGMAKVMPRFRETWDIEKEVVGHMNDLVIMLKDKRDGWAVEEEMFAFQNDEDLARFNEIIAKINAGVERQDEIREQLSKSAAEGMEGIQ